MFFDGKMYVAAKSELIFLMRQLNDNGIFPKLNGNEVHVVLNNESLVNICWVINLYDSLPNKDGKNAISFTIFDDH